MKKLMMVLACVLITGAATASWLGRLSERFASTVTYTTEQIAKTAAVSSIEVVYDSPATLDLYVLVVKGTTTIVRQKIPLTAATSVVYLPDGLWVKRTDSIILSNSVSSAASSYVEFETR